MGDELLIELLKNRAIGQDEYAKKNIAFLSAGNLIRRAIEALKAKDKRIEELEEALKNLIQACKHSIKHSQEEYLCCPGEHCDCRGYTNHSYLKGQISEARSVLAQGDA